MKKRERTKWKLQTKTKNGDKKKNARERTRREGDGLLQSFFIYMMLHPPSATPSVVSSKFSSRP